MLKFTKKKIICDKNYKKKSYYLMGCPLLTKEISTSGKKTKIFGVCVRHKKIKISQEKLQDASLVKKEIENIKDMNVPVILWFDHTWGGGTETYTNNQFKKLSISNLCVRIQGFKNKILKISYFFKEKTNACEIDEEQLSIFFEKMNGSLIVVNNLAGYHDEIEFLSKISDLKHQLKSYVSFRGHDLQCICPSITMMNETGMYCNCKSLEDCHACHLKIKEKIPIFTESIKLWQSSWKKFLENTADEIIVFSNSTKEIFSHLYPKTNSKIQIIPHEVIPLKKVRIPKHSGINIGVLGAIGQSKGVEVIEKIDNLLTEYPQVSLSIIGILSSQKCKYVKVLGKYKPSNLPHIMTENKIDIVFIPSVWPETFSYTTAEAMSMGLPIACFNIGAPAERVAKYNKGLVIDKINARYALEKILHFLEVLNEKEI